MQSPWVNRILDFAIVNEERAAEFYRYLAKDARWEHMKDIFCGFAQEEEQHKAKLLEIKAGAQSLGVAEGIVDLGLAEQVDDVTIDLAGEMDRSEALTIAIKNEQAAYELYSQLADATDNAELKSILQGLAQEEAKHKLRFETEYKEHMRGSP